MKDKKLEDFIDDVDDIDQKERNERFDKRARDGHVLDLYETVMEQEGVAEILEPLSDDDRVYVEQEVRGISEPYQVLMDKLMTQFGTQEARDAFVKAAYERYSKKL